MGNRKIKVEVEIPVGYDLEINGTVCKLVPKSRLPKTWEEFCETYPVQKGECYIDKCADFYNAQSRPRDMFLDQAIFPDRKTAEAFVALAQLIQLRNCYNGDWEPDWKNDHEKKYVILVCRDKVETYRTETANKVLAFKTEELRNQFLKNFLDLIIIAKPLI